MPLASPPSPNCFLPIIDHIMDFSGHGKSPRRELQGPRPTPLKVRKDSHKIRKPPIVPQQQQQQVQPVHRPPVIIYTVSPKIIHANPNEFMQLVQRLTGPNSSTVSSSSSSPVYSSSNSFFQDSGAISPAARYASIEKIKSPEGKTRLQQNVHVQMVEGVDLLSADIDKITGLFPGILSPGPSSLPPIPPNFFSPLSDPNPLSFFHDLSPVLHTSRNYNIEGSFMPSSFIPSPSNNFFSPNINYSPSPSIDLFNNFFDF